MTREQLLSVISGQARLIGSMRKSLRYYSGQTISEVYEACPGDAAILQERALRSNRRVRKLLKEERGDV